METRLREGNISLVLDGYDDLFSDFDPREDSERTLSDDFLLECKRAVRDKGNAAELRLLMPAAKRQREREGVIEHRLKHHFLKHFHEQEREVRAVKLRGARFFGAGALFMLISAALYNAEGDAFFAGRTFLYHLLIVLFEPAGWFSFWTGLDQLFFEAQKRMPEYEFYRKASRLEITFRDY